MHKYILQSFYKHFILPHFKSAVHSCPEKFVVFMIPVSKLFQAPW